MRSMTKEQIEEQLAYVDESDIVQLINDNCGPDDQVYSMDDFEDIVSGDKMDVIRSWIYGYRFNTNDDNSLNDEYFAFNGYGNITTIPSRSLADWLMENLDDYDVIVEWLENNGFLDDEDEE